MTISRMNPTVDFHFNNVEKWQEEFEQSRMIILDYQLNEELNWGCLYYTFQKSNIFLIHGFREYCAILPIKSALLNDAHGILIRQTENVQSGCQIWLTSVRKIITKILSLKNSKDDISI